MAYSVMYVLHEVRVHKVLRIYTSIFQYIISHLFFATTTCN